jgi:energy-coupling factor transporter ATP-binding protein EcfA2
MSQIESIQIQNFRGIRNLKIRLDGKNLLLLGENGTGKSSVVDALEYFFTGQVEKFTGRADVKDRECLPNANGGQPTITLQFIEERAPITVNFPYHKPGVPRSLHDFLSSARARPFILHRAQLLRFIESKPAERYTVVSDLIGLDQLERIEKTWKDSRDTAEKLYDAVQEHYLRCLSALTDLLVPPAEQSFLAPDSFLLETEWDVIKFVQRRLAKHALPSVQGLPDVRVARQAILKKSRSPADITRAEQLRIVQRKCTQLQRDLDQAGQLYLRLVEASEDFTSQLGCLDDAIFETLLQEGRRLLEENALVACPLCEREFTDRGQVLERLQTRLNMLEVLTLSRLTLQVCKGNALELAIALQRDLKLLEEDMVGLKLDVQLPMVRAAFGCVETWRAQFDVGGDSGVIFQDLLLFCEIEDLIAQLKLLDEDSADEILRLTPDKSEQEFFEVTDFLGRLDQTWSAWQNALRERNEAQAVFLQLDLIYHQMIEARKDGLDRLLTQLQGDFITLFEKLHPKEGFQAISLIISRVKRSSIEMEAEIKGHLAMHPYGNYSEGHLDSLGLCLFLAFIRRFNPNFKLIVLDDVLTSIDAGHRMRVARLLAEEFSDYQIILTTHDELWANELKVIMGSKGIKLRFLRLKPWDLAHGTDTDEYVTSDWQFYQQLVKEGHKQDAVAGVGRSLEKFLATMRRNLGLAVPATQDDLYTLGVLYDPFFTWIERHPFARADRPDVLSDFNALKDELDGYWRLRNWSGSHFNDWGVAVSPIEAKDFIQIVQELVALFECPVCASPVIYDSATNLLHCPVCEPQPAPPVNWVYRPDWRNKAQRQLKTGSLKNFEFANGATKSAFEFFLRDMRWIASLAVPPVPEDKYHVEDLFVSFTQWARQHPGSDDPTQALDHMHEFLDAQYCWQEAAVLAPKAEILFQSVDSLIKLFECSTCHMLLHYNDAYYCPTCIKRGEILSPRPAYWPVVRAG